MITAALWSTTSYPTKTFIDSYQKAADSFDEVLSELKIIDSDVALIEKDLESLGAPYTPGRFPTWRKQARRKVKMYLH